MIELNDKQKAAAKFQVALPLKDIVEGTHNATLALVTEDGKTIAQTNAKLIKRPFKDGAAQINHFSRSLMHNGKPVEDAEGRPVYVTEIQDFCSTLWHEMAGHAIAKIKSHPENNWNDYEERDKNPTNWGKSDPSIAIENLYREKRGWPLRRPQYWDKDNPRGN